MVIYQQGRAEVYGVSDHISLSRSLSTHTPEALSEWLAKLRQQYPEGQIAICLEQSKGALIFHLLGYDFLTIFSFFFSGQNTGVRFATLMRILCRRNDGTFVGLNSTQP